MNKLTIETINNDIEEFTKNFSNPTNNHFEFHYNSKDISGILDWFTLWEFNKDNEYMIAGNYIRFYINGEILTNEKVYNYLKEYFNV